MKHLRNRVFFQILIPTAIVFFSITYIFLYFYNKSSQQQSITNKTYEIENAARAINDWLVSKISEMVLMTRTDILTKGNIDKIKEFLNAEQYRLSFVYNKLWYINIDGMYWNTDDRIGKLKNIDIIKGLISGDRPFLYLAPVRLDDREEVDTVFIAIPIFSQGKLKGILGSTILISWFNWVLGYYTYEIFDQVMLVNSQGTIIIHSNRELNGKNEQYVYGEDFSSTMEYENDHAFVSVLRSTWKLVGFINNKRLFSHARYAGRFIWGISFALFLIVSIISIGISRIIANPINSLTAMVNRMMKGDFRQKIEVKTNDELQELATAFNQLNNRLMQLRTDDRFIFLGHLSARMAHEIRKPLNIIQLAAQSILKDEAVNNKYPELIISEIENADKFIKEILGFTKPESISLTLYSISDLLEKVVEKFNLLAQSKNITITVKNISDIPKFYFDILRVEQVFSNIITNSLEALSKNGEIIITMENKNNEDVIIKFVDNGIGFEEDTLDKIYDPYFTTKKNGTGLGLSICYKILMAHGAKIDVRNNSGGGAFIKIIFPLAVKEDKN